MDSIQGLTVDGSVEKEKEVNYGSMVDPFLVEALQNPRHRLTILRMELDIQNFLQNPEQLQFEFQHFPTSYLRLAAHRVAQHYGLQTMVFDNVLDGIGNQIIVIKTGAIKSPPICLSEIPAKLSDNNKHEKIKIAIRRRPSGNSLSGGFDTGMKSNVARTVEERKEEYDKARARIFSSINGVDSNEVLSESSDGKDSCSSEGPVIDSEKTAGVRDVGNSSRVAIFRDREKDRFDPDYDRSYERYVKVFPNIQGFEAPFNMPKLQSPLVQYEAAFPLYGQNPRAQSPLDYRPSLDPNMNRFHAMGSNQTSRGAMYMQWPSPAMIYAHSYDQFRHSVFQAPFCQQPLSFDYGPNH